MRKKYLNRPVKNNKLSKRISGKPVKPKVKKVSMNSWHRKKEEKVIKLIDKLVRDTRSKKISNVKSVSRPTRRLTPTEKKILLLMKEKPWRSRKL